MNAFNLKGRKRSVTPRGRPGEGKKRKRKRKRERDRERLRRRGGLAERLSFFFIQTLFQDHRIISRLRITTMKW